MAITNNQAIFNNTILLIQAGKIQPDEEIHTFQRWKAMGYSVKKGEHAIAKFPIWKMGTKKDEDGEEVITGRCFMKMSAFFSTRQVERLEARA